MIQKIPYTASSVKDFREKVEKLVGKVVSWKSIS